ncbi:MAG: aminodeoxychorismate synthase component I [Candidatus Sedimenticola sp. (ex Thyasira tokunagai)]
MKVVLKHAGKWLRFDQPEKVLCAERVEDVMPMLCEAEASGRFAVGFISYEAAPAFDRAFRAYPPDAFPLLCLGLFSAPDVMEELNDVTGGAYEVGELKPSISKVGFASAIGDIKKRIEEGETYQVNYTYRLTADFSGDPWAFFCRLVESQKTEHAAFVDTGDYTICSASPELFFSLDRGRIVSRPMKGTARRGRTLLEDTAQAEALGESEKDRAENIMIVDMIRNDISRVAELGSVETVSRFDIEKYPTVWQMTSTVRGRIDGKSTSNTEGGVGTVSGIIKNLFPCASITGAPKAKTMEIIHEMEASSRKIYTGTVGFISPQGDACFNVAIRTALIDHTTGMLEYGVGGGIVWESDAEAEYQETQTKARVLTQPVPDFKLLETMLWQPASGIFLLSEHLHRLQESSLYFDIPLDIAAVEQALQQRSQTLEAEDRRLRLLVSRDGAFEVQSYPLQESGEGESLVALAKEPIDSQDIFYFHKTTNRAVYEKARADFPDCDDVILWNEKGEVTEGSIANIVIRREEKLVTPAVECGLLAGTFRGALLQSGEIEESVISIDDLKATDEIFLINSVRKWRRVKLS